MSSHIRLDCPHTAQFFSYSRIGMALRDARGCRYTADLTDFAPAPPTWASQWAS